MPRKPDPKLEKRILNAARKLYLKGGDRALSMRKLARAAHTNTPTIYHRFKNRRQILAALVQHIQEDLFAALEPCSSLQESLLRYLEFALAHPHEYQLVNAGVFSKIQVGRPNLELIRGRTPEWLGGSKEDHTGLVLVLWALLHGTATLLISKAVPSQYEAKLRSATNETIDLIIRNAH